MIAKYNLTLDEIVSLIYKYGTESTYNNNANQETNFKLKIEQDLKINYVKE